MFNLYHLSNKSIKPNFINVIIIIAIIIYICIKLFSKNLSYKNV